MVRRKPRGASAKPEPVLETRNQRSIPRALTAIPGGTEQPASRPEYEAQDLIYDARGRRRGPEAVAKLTADHDPERRRGG